MFGVEKKKKKKKKNRNKIILNVFLHETAIYIFIILNQNCRNKKQKEQVAKEKNERSFQVYSNLSENV